MFKERKKIDTFLTSSLGRIFFTIKNKFNQKIFWQKMKKMHNFLQFKIIAKIPKLKRNNNKTHGKLSHSHSKIIRRDSSLASCFLSLSIKSLLFFYSHSLSAEVGDRVLIPGCAITPQIWSVTAKPPIYFTNNLQQRVGSPFLAAGEPIKIVGKILDNNCRPLTGAVVQIWHADHKGIIRYGAINTYTNDQHLYDKDNVFNSFSEADRDMAMEVGDQSFVGSGTSVTNNLGEYEFTSIMPGKLRPNDSRKVMFYVHHIGSNTNMETRMFFSINEMQIDSEVDGEVRKSGLGLNLVAKETEDLNDLYYGEGKRVFVFNIISPNTTKYRR